MEAVPAEKSAELKAVGEKCLAAADCKAFLDCMLPVVEKQMLEAPPKAPESETPAEETPAEETPAEEAPAGEPAADDAPTDA